VREACSAQGREALSIGRVKAMRKILASKFSAPGDVYCNFNVASLYLDFSRIGTMAMSSPWGHSGI
jgi:hypothetical protein